MALDFPCTLTLPSLSLPIRSGNKKNNLRLENNKTGRSKGMEKGREEQMRRKGTGSCVKR